MKPTLPERMEIKPLLLRVGIDPLSYREDDRVVLLRPSRWAPLQSLQAQAANLQLRSSTELDQLFSRTGRTAGATGAGTRSARLDRQPAVRRAADVLVVRLPSERSVRRGQDRLLDAGPDRTLGGRLSARRDSQPGDAGQPGICSKAAGRRSWASMTPCWRSPTLFGSCPPAVSKPFPPIATPSNRRPSSFAA